MITLKVFGDESADERAERVFALGVIAGTETEWAEAIQHWLSVTGGEDFHANVYETRYPSKYAALVRGIAESDLVGISIAVDVAAFRAVTPKWEKDTAYCKCFGDLLGHLSGMTQKWNDRIAEESNPTDEPIRPEITLDRRQGSGTLVQLYDTFLEQPEWRDSEILSTGVKFDTRKNPRIQVADLFAREAMKDMDMVIHGITDKRFAHTAFAGAHAKQFQAIQYGREFWDGWQDRIAAVGQKEGIAMEGYAQWIHDTGRVQNGIPADNLKNKFAYLAWLDNKQAMLKRSKAKKKA